MINKLFEDIVLPEYISSNEIIDMQMILIDRIHMYERKILVLREKTKKLKKSKKQYGKLENKSVDKIKRYEDIINKLIEKEERFSCLRGKLKFIGDCLVYRIYDEFDIRQLSKNNDPGFSYGKDGNSFEVDILRSFYDTGIPAVLHDITNCLRIGDVSYLNEFGKPSLFECKSVKSSKSEVKIRDRFLRQLDRMEAVITTINSKDDVISDTLTDEQLYEYGMPKKIVEVDIRLKYYYEKFENICNEITNYNISEVEDGLIYGVSKIEYIDDFYKSFHERYDDRPLVPSNLLRRIEGDFINVIPFAIGLKNIENVVNIYNVDLVAFVFLDLQILVDKFKEKGHDIIIYHDDEKDVSSIEIVGGNIEIGPRIIHSVQYGLLSLESAIQFMTYNLNPN